MLLCTVLCAVVLYRADSKPFVVGTYHMPCMFKVPSVMMIHCALSAQHIHKYANNDPYLLVGDFNIKPGTTPLLLSVSLTFFSISSYLPSLFPPFPSHLLPFLASFFSALPCLAFPYCVMLCPSLTQTDFIHSCILLFYRRFIYV